MKFVQSTNAPQAIGSYAQAIVANGFIFCSGQIGLDPKTGKLVGQTIEEQTHQVMKNLEAVLQAAESDFMNVVKTTIYLKNIADFAKVNEIYAYYFIKNKPARATIGVANLPLNALIEIEATATLRVV